MKVEPFGVNILMELQIGGTEICVFGTSGEFIGTMVECFVLHGRSSRGACSALRDVLVDSNPTKGPAT